MNTEDMTGTGASRPQGSSVRFASNIIGNIGAPLDHSSSVLDNEDNEDHIHQANGSLQQDIDNPLAVGILSHDLVAESRYALLQA